MPFRAWPCLIWKQSVSGKNNFEIEADIISELLPFPGRREVLSGYEIHMGRSVSGGRAKPLFRILRRDGKPADIEDGLAQPDGKAWGTYIHGIFDNDGFRNMFLEDIGKGPQNFFPTFRIPFPSDSGKKNSTTGLPNLCAST